MTIQEPDVRKDCLLQLLRYLKNGSGAEVEAYFRRKKSQDLLFDLLRSSPVLILQAFINERKSIRAFKPDAVPEEILKEIMELAQRAPSWSNTQPWEFAIVRGSKLEEIRQIFVEKAGEQSNPDLATPQKFPEPFGFKLHP